MSGLKHTVNFGEGRDLRTGERWKVEVEQDCYICQRYNGSRCGVVDDWPKYSSFNDCPQWVLHAGRAGTD